MQPVLWYDPPYERPLEDEFAWHLVKYLDPVSNLEYQVEVETPTGSTWIDFMVTQGGKRYGFEISACGDEDEYVETTYRDAMVISSGSVDVLYRLRCEDLLHYVHLTLSVVMQSDKSLFSPRGQRNIKTLAGPDGNGEVVVRRLDHSQPRQWTNTYAEACSFYGVTP